MDAPLGFLLWMLPFVALAASVMLIGYLAYAASLAKRDAEERALHPAPDPIHELERVNTELARASAAARLTLEATRETVRKGTR